MLDQVDNADLIIDAPAPGAWNMALDQALLQAADAYGQATLRFYAWETATLSLGYFQKLADRETHPGSLGCPVVRRASGGGAIVHDQELTFSLTFPSSNRWSGKNNDLYRSVHGCIVEYLISLGLDAGLYENSVKDSGERQSLPIDSSKGRSAKPFLCFQRRTDGDIVLNGHKIGGSAQRRSKNAILQHTSLLLRKSSAAKELPGIEDLAGGDLKQDELISQLVEKLSKTLLVAFKPAKVAIEVKKSAENILEEMFGNALWVAKK